ncbi:unnamed protein product [Ixodes pacificus]
MLSNCEAEPAVSPTEDPLKDDVADRLCALFWPEPPQDPAGKVVVRRFLAASPELGGQPQLEQPARIVDIQPARDQQQLFGLEAASYWLIV